MGQITFSTITTFQPPYNIYVCNVYGNLCDLVATITTTSPPSITIQLPPQFDTVPAVGIKMVSSACCEHFEVVYCT